MIRQSLHEKSEALIRLKSKFDSLCDSSKVFEVQIENLKTQKLRVEQENSSLRDKMSSMEVKNCAEIDSAKVEAESIKEENQSLKLSNECIVGTNYVARKNEPRIDKFTEDDCTVGKKNDVTTPSVANAGSKDNIKFNDNGEQATLKEGTNGEPLMVGLALTNTNSQTIFCDYLWKIAQAGPSVGTSVKRLLQEIQDTKSSPLYNDDSDIATLKALVDKIELNYPNQETTDAALSKVDTDSQLISPTHAGNHNRADPKLESPLDTKSKPGVDNLCSAPKTIDTLIVEIGVIDKENEKKKNSYIENGSRSVENRQQTEWYVRTLRITERNESWNY